MVKGSVGRSISTTISCQAQQKVCCKVVSHDPVCDYSTTNTNFILRAWPCLKEGIIFVEGFKGLQKVGTKEPTN
jgi:hypothetical protein